MRSRTKIGVFLGFDNFRTGLAVMNDVSRGCLEFAVVDNWRGAARKYRVALVGWEIGDKLGWQRDELGVWSALVLSSGKKYGILRGRSPTEDGERLTESWIRATAMTEPGGLKKK
jgi:hypothetical protein